MRYAGSDWLRPQCPQLSVFGALIADILGQVYAGLYHLDLTLTGGRRIRWDAEDYILVEVYGELASFDASYLTALLVLCHDNAVRLAIQRGGRLGTLKLHFSKRQHNVPDFWARHPTLEQAVERIRTEFGLQTLAPAAAKEGGQGQ